MTSDWSGSSTWSSLGDGIQVGTEAHATADLVVAKTTAGAGNFDVTASLTAWLSGATTSDEANLANKGWAFLANGTDSWDFSSFEGAGQPVLTVSYTVSGGSEAMMANSLSAKSAEVVDNGGTSVGGRLPGWDAHGDWHGAGLGVHHGWDLFLG